MSMTNVKLIIPLLITVLLITVLLITVLLITGCTSQALSETPPADPLLTFDFHEMNEDTFRSTITELGWTEFADFGMFTGTFLGFNASLSAEYAQPNQAVSALHIQTHLRSETLRETVEQTLESLPATDWNPLRACQYYDASAQGVAAQWLADAKAAVRSAGGTLDETGTIRLSGDSVDALQAMLSP